jgi:RNA polymerase subunit RPABC4/transcription elongation factor Spt4
MNECTRCRGQVPANAEACMHCGATFTNTDSYAWGTAIGLLIVVVAVIWVWMTEGF